MLFCLMAYESYSQNQIKAPVVLSSFPSLSAQRLKLDAKQAEINQTVSGHSAQINKLNETYTRLLKLELAKSMDEQLSNQLSEEITRYSKGITNQIHYF